MNCRVVKEESKVKIKDEAIKFSPLINVKSSHSLAKKEKELILFMRNCISNNL